MYLEIMELGARGGGKRELVEERIRTLVEVYLLMPRVVGLGLGMPLLISLNRFHEYRRRVADPENGMGLTGRPVLLFHADHPSIIPSLHLLVPHE